MKNKRNIFICLLIVASLILIEIIGYKTLQDKRQRKYNISVVVYNDGKDWDSLKAGAQRAAQNRNAEVTFVTTTDELTSEEQYSLIKREIDNGADGVLVAADDSYSMSELMTDKDIEKKVVFVENGISSDPDGYVTTSNYRMGSEIATEICANVAESQRVALVYYDNTKIALEQRRQGFTDTFETYGRDVLIWEKEEDSKDQTVEEFITDNMKKHPADVLVVLTDARLEQVVFAVDSLIANPKIYAIGNSDKAVYYLDSRKIECLVFPDEFGMGYAGVECILGSKKDTPEKYTELITFKTVWRANMYSGEYEKVLFPFVK